MSSSNSTRNHGYSGYLKYLNRHCHCGKRAHVRISKSSKNPNRLLYCCPDSSMRKNVKTGCGYFLWAVPVNEQRDVINPTEENASNFNREFGETNSYTQPSNDEFRKMKNQLKRLVKKKEREDTKIAVLQGVVVGLVLALFMFLIKSN